MWCAPDHDEVACCCADGEHEWGATLEQQRGGAYTGKTKWQHIAGEANEEGVPVRTLNPEAWGLVDGHPAVASGLCVRCGAWRGCLGLEPTPELYVAHVVEVFREVRRVLRADGTLWLNLGDSYFSRMEGNGWDSADWKTGDSPTPRAESVGGRRERVAGLKPKDLVGIPWRVAFALQADGWWLRQDIVWAKPNPMPESVRDRCTKAHEYVFLLSKSERYYWDGDAIREPASNDPRGAGLHNGYSPPGQSPHRGAQRAGVKHAGKNETDTDHRKHGFNERWDAAAAAGEVAAMRNKRSVWTVPTSPFPEAHFATFPPALVAPMILAGAPPDGVVLDPFVGSGTTVIEAKRLGRRGIGIDMNAGPGSLESAVRGLQLGRRVRRKAAAKEGQASLEIGR